MVVSIKRSRTCIEITNNPEIIYFIGTILLAECSYEATLPDGSVVPQVVDQFIVVEKGAFATFYIDRSAVNYNVNMINAVHFGDQEVSMFANVRVADFDKRQNIFFPGARVNALGGSIESTWQFTSPFDAPHICSLYACK
ncbi:hypothetical protein PAHAL_6G292800 [Panicum hallii]|uniref:Uncharacterized protein n=1 Tax=Panicum hallii TaxID=206008 RepID=A0A2S3I4I1_9POAL|nr:hypothetical protein PAHAL_6G292800 [Panicum hallii]